MALIIFRVNPKAPYNAKQGPLLSGSWLFPLFPCLFYHYFSPYPTLTYSITHVSELLNFFFFFERARECNMYLPMSREKRGRVRETILSRFHAQCRAPEIMT